MTDIHKFLRNGDGLINGIVIHQEHPLYWSLKGEIASILVDLLEEFRKERVTFPHAYFEAAAEDGNRANRTWDDDLKTMVKAFEWYADEYSSDGEKPDYVDQGLALFAKNYHNLWD